MPSQGRCAPMRQVDLKRQHACVLRFCANDLRVDAKLTAPARRAAGCKPARCVRSRNHAGAGATGGVTEFLPRPGAWPGLFPRRPDWPSSGGGADQPVVSVSGKQRRSAGRARFNPGERSGSSSPGRLCVSSVGAALLQEDQMPDPPRYELVPPHSITSSARASRNGGTVSPIVLAVLRLMTNSNFVGCSTGRSAGFSPLRILST